MPNGVRFSLAEPMRRIVLLILLLSVPQVTWADLPIPVITGPSGGVPGDLLVLDASESQADHFSWAVVPEIPDGRLTILVIEGGRKCVVASVPGTYTVILAAGTADGVAVKKHTVTVSGGGNTPDPIKPRPPEPVIEDRFGLSPKVKSWVQAVSDRSRQQQLSQAFRTAADRANTIGDLKKLESETRSNLSGDLVREAIGGASNASNWAPLFEPMGTEISRMDREGKIGTLADYQQAWREIAEGLR